MPRLSDAMKEIGTKSAPQQQSAAVMTAMLHLIGLKEARP